MQFVLHLRSAAIGNALACMNGQNARLARFADDQWFLLIDNPSDDALQRAACLPGIRYRLIDGEWLVPLNAAVAKNRLPPDLSWEQLDRVLRVELPPAGFAGQLDPQPQSLQLARCLVEHECSAVIVSMLDLLDWVNTASVVRLGRLRWACRGNQALVVGSPMPPIQAKYFYETNRVLIPAGFSVYPALPPVEVRAVFQVADNDWLIWETQDHWTTIADDLLIQMRRASVRQLAADIGISWEPAS